MNADSNTAIESSSQRRPKEILVENEEWSYQHRLVMKQILISKV